MVPREGLVSFRSARLRRPASARFIAVAAALSVLTLLVSWAIAFKYWPSEYATSNSLSLFDGYAERIADGEIPYRDFRLEYPPAALPMFLAPLAAPNTRHPKWTSPADDNAHHYIRAFAALATMLMAVTICLTAFSLARLKRSQAEVLAACSLLGASAIALGGVLYMSFDVWPAALVAAAVAALLSRRFGLSGLALGFGIAAKLYPVVLLPLFVTFAWRRYGRREAVLTFAVCVAVVLAVILPFAALGPDGMVSALGSQLERGLHLDSLGSAVILVLDKLGVTFGSVPPYQHDVTGVASGLELAGGGTDTAVVVLNGLRTAALLGLWISFATGAVTSDRLVRWVAAVMAATVAFGNVLTPQFVVWLLALVPLVGGRRGLAATTVLTASVVLTHIWYPYLYADFPETLSAGGVVFLLLRDLVLVALLIVLVAPSRFRGSRSFAVDRIGMGCFARRVGRAR